MQLCAGARLNHGSELVPEGKRLAVAIIEKNICPKFFPGELRALARRRLRPFDAMKARTEEKNASSEARHLFRRRRQLLTT